MPAISVDGAITDVHAGFAPGTISASGPKFTVGGVPVLRVGDSVSEHVYIPDPKVKHSGMVVAAGASTFTIGGKAVARLGDPTNCGAKIAIGVGSFTVGG
ncbi:PAAR domain-containing protein [Pseudoalteromonas sp. SMS1]|uniref:PAAR domain-containing protein n=1 Tax=Pseudoalteromonas sp. SMS1 TaxID=2908894 RepID=UPI001F33369E|nr:PAAR domain-containing protein [Pseudoalteromonas sp. SMS1]MCF2856451.1 PAAR domain-containing protein [Pseudoalteromonas sp. SMS1]